MRKKLTASIWKEDKWFIAQCLEIDIASQGKTRGKALVNLREAINLFFECADDSEIARRYHSGVQVMEFEVARG